MALEQELETFESKLPELRATHEGEFALVHGRRSWAPFRASRTPSTQATRSSALPRFLWSGSGQGDGSSSFPGSSRSKSNGPILAATHPPRRCLGRSRAGCPDRERRPSSDSEICGSASSHSLKRTRYRGHRSQPDVCRSLRRRGARAHPHRDIPGPHTIHWRQAQVG